MQWLTDALWAWCRVVSGAMELAGFIGVIACAVVGAGRLSARVVGWINREAR